MEPKLILFVLMATLAATPAAKAYSQDTISWRANRPLTWSDYRARPEAGSPFAAITTAGIGYRLSYTRRSMKATVFCYMLPARSWVKSTARKTLLTHEQLHFDITEIYARRLQKAFNAYRFRFQTVSRDLNRLFEKIDKEKNKANEQYDRETNFSLNDTQQARWGRKVKAALVHDNLIFR